MPALRFFNPTKPRFFYGWVIVVTLSMVNFATMATGTLNFGLFVIPMGDELEMSRGFIGWSQTARLLAGGSLGFVMGRLLDRYGPRMLIAIASLVTGSCMIGLSYVQDPWQFLVLFNIMGFMGLSAPGAILTSVPVAKWFIGKRGTALALATMGLGTGGIVFLPVTQFLIDSIGWRHAWFALSIISMAIILPLSIVFLKRQPEDLGLTPYVSQTEQDKSTKGQETSRLESFWTAGQATRTSTFWWLMLYFALVGFAMGSTNVHRLPYWIEAGFDEQLVAYAFAADAAGAALMALGAGIVVDRIPVRFVALASCLGFVVSVGLMLSASNTVVLFVSTTLFGFAVGANMIVTSFIWADYFGRTFLGTIRGIVLPLTLTTIGLGSPIAGYIYDFTGSYNSVWWMLIVLFGLASVVIVNIKGPVQERLNSEVGVQN
ncbi:MFS transporter [SAR202 cluster bacterium AD-804-J14_MRT_500m]|nr:MFS transporter [SAR202 cluster bacterium AD-804-J14_MRT_500m]